MPRFRNDTGSVLRSQEFGVIPPGEFEAEGYDPEVHGVIPGCTWLDAPPPEAEDAPAGNRKRSGKAAAGTDTEAGE